MKHWKRKGIIYVCAITVMFSLGSPTHASTELTVPYSQPESIVEKEATSMTMTVDEAVDYALKFNTTIRLIDNQVSLAKITYYEAKDNAEDLEDADDQLDDAIDLLNYKTSIFESSEAQLVAAEAAIEADIAPEPIPLVDDAGSAILNPATGEQVVIPTGTTITPFLVEQLTGLYMFAGLDAASASAKATEDAVAYDEKIVALVEESLSDSRLELEQNRVALAEGNALIELKKSDMNAKLEQISQSVESKISYSSVITHTYSNANRLMINMAGMNMNVTNYAKDIYDHQIAMLIQKNYYDALLANKEYELKVKAEERGAKQYDLIKLSYDNGMKSRQDMLLAKMYYEGTKASTVLANASNENAKIELKKNLNLPLECDLTLVEPAAAQVTDQDLFEGIKSGLTKRVEVQKSLGYLMIYELNEDILKSRYGSGVENRAKSEATILRQSAEIELEETNQTVEAEIRQSYALMKATEEMLVLTENLVSEAEEVLEIATLRYDQGLGSDNALLTSLNLNSSSGTILEVIAAQENLESMELKEAQIEYNCIMAQIKYKNDAALINVME